MLQVSVQFLWGWSCLLQVRACPHALLLLWLLTRMQEERLETPAKLDAVNAVKVWMWRVWEVRSRRSVLLRLTSAPPSAVSWCCPVPY